MAELRAQGLSLGIQAMPPGYRLDRADSGHYYWVRPIIGTGVGGEPDDHNDESAISWDRWAAWRGAWRHYRANGKPGPLYATTQQRLEAIRSWKIRRSAWFSRR